MRRLVGLATTVIAAGTMLAGCAATPGDTITELEDTETGVKVETHDGKEFAMRDGLPCNVDDRLSECADEDDKLVEQEGAREGDPKDFEHDGEESNETGSDG